MKKSNENEKKRVWGKNISINDTQEFFEKRIEKHLPHRYNYVMYQDDNPELAIERDRYEKAKFINWLNIKSNSRVLDIGCGVGRWADTIAPMISDGDYIGVDFSYSLLGLAKEVFKSNSNCHFYQGSFQELKQVLKKNNQQKLYNSILINGVLMYINDDDIEKCLSNAKEYMAPGGVIYIKESVGVGERLTLNKFYSKEMKAEYSAIYRDIEQYSEIFSRIFDEKSGFSVLNSGHTWETQYSNRKETSSYFWIIKFQG